jgi:hypothetical protein
VSTNLKIARVCGHDLSTYFFTVDDMNGPIFHYSDDYISLMARERQARMLQDAVQRRAIRAARSDATRTRSRFLRWHR